MKIRFFCPDCSAQRTTQGYVSADLRDDGLYEVKCQLGHRRVVGLGNLKFELLFDSGALALLDGHYLEAVASFAAALERFIEFYIIVLCLKHEVAPDQLDQAWKQISSQSERQLGAFFLLYLIENKKPLAYIDQKKVKFRNEVIHKGYIPTPAEARDYGEHLFDFIGRVFLELNRSSDDFVGDAIARDHRGKMRQMPKNQARFINIQHTMMNATSMDYPFAKSFTESLEVLKKGVN